LETGGNKENSCSALSLGVDNGERGNSRRDGYSSRQWGLCGRPTGEFTIDDKARSRLFARETSHKLEEKLFSNQYQNLEMFTMWKDVQKIPACTRNRKKILFPKMLSSIATSKRSRIHLHELWKNIREKYTLRKRSSQILFSRMLCGEIKIKDGDKELPILRTAIYQRPYGEKQILFKGVCGKGKNVYDITVEDDASFVIEGLISHNTNCRCFWDIVDKKDRWDCYWQMSSVRTEHCQTCLDRSRKWNPYVIEKE
jgi:hypothetical protein